MEAIGRGLTTALDHYQDQILQSFPALSSLFFWVGFLTKTEEQQKDFRHCIIVFAVGAKDVRTAVWNT